VCATLALGHWRGAAVARGRLGMSVLTCSFWSAEPGRKGKVLSRSWDLRVAEQQLGPVRCHTGASLAPVWRCAHRCGCGARSRKGVLGLPCDTLLLLALQCNKPAFLVQGACVLA